MSQNPSEDDSATNSAPNALFLLPLEGSQFASVKCTECKAVTVHEWIKVTPVPVLTTDPMELLKLTKRLTLCTQCGLIKTIN